MNSSRPGGLTAERKRIGGLPESALKLPEPVGFPIQLAVAEKASWNPA
jgi:hypothetical protein